MGLMGQMSLISPMSRIRRGYWIFHSSLFALHVSPPWRGRGRLLHLFPVLSLHRSGSAPAYGGAERLCQPCGKRRDDDDVLFILKNAVRRKALRHCSRLQVFGFQLIQGLQIPVVMSCELQIRRNYNQRELFVLLEINILCALRPRENIDRSRDVRTWRVVGINGNRWN